MIRVVIVEDNAAFRRGLEELASHTPGLSLAGSFGSAEALLAAAAAQGGGWDQVIMDIGLPGVDGVEATRRLKALRPAVRVLVLTVFEEPARIIAAIGAGADGYALKSTPAREVVEQLHAIREGRAHFTAAVAQALLGYVRDTARNSRTEVITLTDRERLVLKRLVDGMTYGQIASALEVSIETVRTHLRSVYGKLQVHNAAAAVAKALRDGLV